MNKANACRTAFATASTILAATSFAGVALVSRTSSVTAMQDLTPVPPFGYGPNYNESAAYTEFGPWAVTLPHGASHTSNATAGAMSGSFQSNYYENNELGSVGVWYAKASSLAVDFQIIHRKTGATILLNGYCILLRNAYLTIHNLDTGELVFDSIDHGWAQSPGDFEGSEMRWDMVQSNVDLAIGNYRLLVGANYDNTFHPGPGQGNQARANLDASVLFGCDADLDGDGFVDDSDFQVFVLAYDSLLCEDPMVASCPCDLNDDAAVDDADFQIFVIAYNETVCP